MQHVELVNYVDICSNSFLKLVDDGCEKLIYDNDRIIIDVTIPRAVKMLQYYIRETIESRSRAFGHTYVIYNTCKPLSNWRRENLEISGAGAKYILCDNSILVNLYKLERIFDIEWNKFLKNKVITTIDFEFIDSIDIEYVIQEIIGKRYSFIKKPEFRLLKDGNAIYNRTLPIQVPDYLYQEIEMELQVKNIIV